jgi:sugar phosphate isomerase/epimerase
VSQNIPEFSVFTKPWRMALPELGEFIHRLGFSGIELPLRPGYQVSLDRLAEELPRAVHILADFGVRITSVAASTNEAVFAACAEAAVPIVRICVNVGEEGYRATESRLQREFDGLVPLLERYGVTLGIQNHCHRSVYNAMGLWRLIQPYDPHRIAAVWDVAHNALQGEDPEDAIDIIWDRLCLVNFKNAYWQRTNGPEAEEAAWRVYWTTGRHGLASWPRVARELQRRGYKGGICLSAEYSDEPAVDRLTAEDISYARSVFQR